MIKKILKVLLKLLMVIFMIPMSIFVFIAIVHFLFFTNKKYIFPVELGRIVYDDEINYGASLNRTPADVLEILDQIEQEQIYDDIDNLERLREKIESIDNGYIYISNHRPLRYITYYEGDPILGDLSDGWGSFGRYGEDNGNVLYFYYMKRWIILPLDGRI